jgi:hypothetical protein
MKINVINNIKHGFKKLYYLKKCVNTLNKQAEIKNRLKNGTQ